MSSKMYDYLAMLCLLLFVAIIAVIFSDVGAQCEQRTPIEMPVCKGK